MALSGGEAWPVTRLERGVEDFGWIDGESLVIAAQESPSLWEQQRKAANDTSRVVDDAEHEPPIRLFRVELEGGKVEPLTRNSDWIESRDPIRAPAAGSHTGRAAQPVRVAIGSSPRPSIRS